MKSDNIYFLSLSLNWLKPSGESITTSSCPDAVFSAHILSLKFSIPSCTERVISLVKLYVFLLNGTSDGTKLKLVSNFFFSGRHFSLFTISGSLFSNSLSTYQLAHNF